MRSTKSGGGRNRASLLDVLDPSKLLDQPVVLPGVSIKGEEARRVKGAA